MSIATGDPRVKIQGDHAPLLKKSNSHLPTHDYRHAGAEKGRVKA